MMDEQRSREYEQELRKRCQRNGTVTGKDGKDWKNKLEATCTTHVWMSITVCVCVRVCALVTVD